MFLRALEGCRDLRLRLQRGSSPRSAAGRKRGPVDAGIGLDLLTRNEDLGCWGAGIGEGEKQEGREGREVQLLNPKAAQFVPSPCPEQRPGGI